jgi:hypothetical protein
VPGGRGSAPGGKAEEERRTAEADPDLLDDAYTELGVKVT